MIWERVGLTSRSGVPLPLFTAQCHEELVNFLLKARNLLATELNTLTSQVLEHLMKL